MSTEIAAGRPAGPPPNPHLWSRDGFNGDICVTSRPYPIVEYTDVRGPHVPQRVDLASVATADHTDAAAPPTIIAHSRADATISVSRRTAPTPFLWRNAENDELHFIQEGEFDYLTDFGLMHCSPGDFVYVPRAVTYRVVPTTTSALRIIVETPSQIALKPPAPFGMINFARDVGRPDPGRAPALDGPVQLLVKSFDGVTEYTLPRDPMALNAIIGGSIPVWRLNLAAIQPLTYLTHGGPPDSFAETADRDLLFYTLSARSGDRPPMHHNADYDELIFYFRGPGEYGSLTAPGQLAWVPKSIAHWGPNEDVPDGYLAWLIESTGTMRLTLDGAAAAQLMETGEFGVSNATRLPGAGE